MIMIILNKNIFYNISSKFSNLGYRINDKEKQ